ncbi:TPA: hypothetical protein ACU16Q_000267 [Pasteurella multocida]|uniref:hypothetical protein n=1 Tax=Pasteurella multocida TaxID=747 RepID=UPI0018985CE4|nr:hypothetical protein [Pasteurella multocida]MBF6982037.1 hypothetical protein [Pasteurella multocida]
MRKLNFFIIDGKKYSTTEEPSEWLDGKKIKNYQLFEIEYDSELNIVNVNDVHIDCFLKKNPIYQKESFEEYFKYDFMPNWIKDDDYIKVKAYVVATPPKNTRASVEETCLDSLNFDIAKTSFDFLLKDDDDDDIRTQNNIKIQKAIDTYNEYVEHPQSRIFLHLILEIKYYRANGDLLVLNDYSDLHKSRKFIYRYDFENPEEFRRLIHNVIYADHYLFAD